MKFLFVLLVVIQDQGSVFMQQYETQDQCLNQQEAHQAEFAIRSIPANITCEKITKKKWAKTLRGKVL